MKLQTHTTKSIMKNNLDDYQEDAIDWNLPKNKKFIAVDDLLKWIDDNEIEINKFKITALNEYPSNGKIKLLKDLKQALEDKE